MNFTAIKESLEKNSLKEIQTHMDAATNGYQIFNPFQDPIEPETGGTTDSKLKIFNFKKEDFENKTVSDLGCNLGAFSFLAINNGAKKTISYEVDPNFKKFLDLLINDYTFRFPYYAYKMDTVEINLNTLPKLIKTDVVLCIAIIHWFFALDKTMTLEKVAKWLSDMCGETLFFEGCVTASEPVMQQYKVDVQRYNEKALLDAMSKYFDYTILGRPKYNPNRLVAKFTKK